MMTLLGKGSTQKPKHEDCVCFKCQNIIKRKERERVLRRFMELPVFDSFQKGDALVILKKDWNKLKKSLEAKG